MKDFIPVLMGNDINVYSMARAFHEEYNKKSYVFCKILSGPCQNSDIITLKANKDIDKKDVFLEEINKFAIENIDKTILLVGCGDNYVEVISSNLKSLENNIIAPYMDFNKLEPLTNKENFYKLCEEHGISYPKTTIINYDDYIKNINTNINSEAPFIVKPSDSVEYWKYPFENQDKVFILNTIEDVNKTVEKIFNSGYRKSIIIQEYIPGDDTNMRVLTCYSNREAKVNLMALGHVLLEEHTPKGIGNHALILNEYNENLCMKYKTFLEKMSYIGFSNFDIKYDSRDNEYKAFELNPRQGRSNFYVTNSGYNLAKILVEDYILNRNKDSLNIINNEKLWMVVPKGVAFKYVLSDELREKMKLLIKTGNSVNPLLYEKDNNIIRKLKISKNILSHFWKFKKYYGDK